MLQRVEIDLKNIGTDLPEIVLIHFKVIYIKLKKIVHI